MHPLTLYVLTITVTSCFWAQITGPEQLDKVLCLNGSVLARKGDQSPIPRRIYERFGELDLNDSGSYAHFATLDGDILSDEVIIKDGQKFVQEGDQLSDLDPWVVERLPGEILEVSNRGDVLWLARTDNPDGSQDEVLMLNQKAIVQTGITIVQGLTVSAIRDDAGHS